MFIKYKIKCKIVENQYINWDYIRSVDIINYNKVILEKLENMLKSKWNLDYMINLVEYWFKIKNINFSSKIDYDNNNYYWYIDTIFNINLTQEELNDLEWYILWELSDGWWEWFEQEPFYIIDENNLTKEYVAIFRSDKLISI
jgi:hypothetical protein